MIRSESDTILKILRYGKFLGKWTNIGSPWGLDYVARENAIYMCDGVNNRVVKLNLDGEVLGVLGSYGKVPVGAREN